MPEPVIRPGDAPCRFLADILDFTIAEARRRSANCGLTRSHGVLDEMLADAGFAVESSIDITAHMMPMASAFSVIGKFPFWVE